MEVEGSASSQLRNARVGAGGYLAGISPPCQHHSTLSPSTGALESRRRDVRLLCGFFQSAVARTFGVSRQTVWRAEQPEGVAFSAVWPAHSAAHQGPGPCRLVKEPGGQAMESRTQSRTGGPDP